MTMPTITRADFPTLFGGLGFHNSEALFYRLCEKEQFDQKIGKCYRELSPGFMRTFGGYANWTKESMDTFADYYERMQKVTGTPIYLACAKGQLHFSDEARREYVMKAIRCDGKRLILGELGVRHMREEDGQLRMDDFVHLPGVMKDVNAFNYHGDGPLGAIMYAEAALAAINAGVFAISIWTFCDYPDLYVCHYAEHDEYARKWGECERFISQTQDTKYNKCGLIKWEDDGDYSVRESY